MGNPSDYLRLLARRELSDEELVQFLVLLDGEAGEADRLEALNHLFAVVQLQPTQLKTIGSSESVKSFGSLQLALRRYANAREREASQAASESEPAWKFALRWLGGL